jgi:hypothetical protein
MFNRKTTFSAIRQGESFMFDRDGAITIWKKSGDGCTDQERRLVFIPANAPVLASNRSRR